MLGLGPDGVNSMLIRARKDKAPFDAVVREDGIWVTWAQIPYETQKLMRQVGESIYKLPETGITEDMEFEPIDERTEGAIFERPQKASS